MLSFIASRERRTSRAGFNTMRVFLHDLIWAQDSADFLARINLFLTIADNHGIKVILVLFDSCWDPYPRLGPQAEPVPGIHNSRWVQVRSLKTSSSRALV